MRLKITTEYTNCNQEFIDWYMKRLSTQEVLPGCKSIIETLKETGHASFSSADPDSPTIATTTYELSGMTTNGSGK